MALLQVKKKNGCAISYIELTCKVNAHQNNATTFIRSRSKNIIELTYHQLGAGQSHHL
jgi:hypothetical protein